MGIKILCAAHWLVMRVSSINPYQSFLHSHPTHLHIFMRQAFLALSNFRITQMWCYSKKIFIPCLISFLVSFLIGCSKYTLLDPKYNTFSSFKQERVQIYINKFVDIRPREEQKGLTKQTKKILSFATKDADFKEKIDEAVTKRIKFKLEEKGLYADISSDKTYYSDIDHRKGGVFALGETKGEDMPRDEQALRQGRTTTQDKQVTTLPARNIRIGPNSSSNKTYILNGEIRHFQVTMRLPNTTFVPYLGTAATIITKDEFNVVVSITATLKDAENNKILFSQLFDASEDVNVPTGPLNLNRFKRGINYRLKLLDEALDKVIEPMAQKINTALVQESSIESSLQIE